MFMEALFTIANIWKQPKGQSKDEWRKYHMYNEILPNHKKGEILCCHNMGGCCEYYVKWNKSDGKN